MGSRGAPGRASPPAWALLALLSLALVAGCGGGGGDRLPELGEGGLDGAKAPAGPSTTAGGAGGAGSALDSDERVLADYAAYWDAVIDAYAESAWRSGRLRQHATGTQLDFLRNDLLANLTGGKVARGKPRLFGAQVERRSDGKASVEDCIDSNRWLLHDAKTGKLADTPSGKHYRVTATLRLEEQRWKVADVTYKEERCGT